MCDVIDVRSRRALLMNRAEICAVNLNVIFHEAVQVEDLLTLFPISPFFLPKRDVVVFPTYYMLRNCCNKTLLRSRLIDERYNTVVFFCTTCSANSVLYRTKKWSFANMNNSLKSGIQSEILLLYVILPRASPFYIPLTKACVPFFFFFF